MRLTKHARTKIRKAKGPVEIQWPLSAGIPVEGNEYVAGHGLRIVVLARRKTPKGRWKVMVTENHDPFRTLRIKATQEADPESGFKRETEPEPVDPLTQARFDAEGALKTEQLGGEQRLGVRVHSKEGSLSSANTERSRKTKERHLRSLEGKRAA